MLLRMSLSGGILIIMIAAVRLLAVNRLPKQYFMMLWGVALLRLLVPAELPFRFGVTIPVEKAVADKMKLVVLNRNFLQEAAIRQGAGQAGADIREGIMQALPWLWAAGTLALSAALIVLYLRECRRMNEAIPLEAEQACRLRAEAEAKAIESVRNAFGDAAGYAEYLKAIRYIDTMKDVFSGKDVKTIFMPYGTEKALGSAGVLSELLGRKDGQDPFVIEGEKD